MDRKCSDSVQEFLFLLRKCKKSRDLAGVMHAHTQILLSGYETDVALGNFLVQAYAKCGHMHDGQIQFNTLADVDEYSWTSLIQGHVECRQYQQGLASFILMQKGRVQPSRYTFVAVAKACGHLKAWGFCLCVHIRAAKMGFDGESYVGNALLSMYTVGGYFVEAQKMFELLPKDLAISWNILMTGYVEYGFGEKVLEFLDCMQSHNVPLSEVTFIGCLRACSSLRAVSKGRDLHYKAIMLGADKDLSVRTTLIDFYSKCGLAEEAQKAINHLQLCSIVPWNALIIGFVENGLGKEALGFIDEMKLNGCYPNAVTSVGGLKACIITQNLDRGQELHNEIVKTGLDNVSSVGNSLIDMYSKCGAFMESCNVFDKLPDRGLISWTSLITGFVDHGAYEKAISCLENMPSEGMVPDAAAYVCGLKACGCLKDPRMARELHAMILKMGHERNLYVGNMILDAYMKAELLTDGQEVFNVLPFQNLVAWNTSIAGYTEHGLSEESLLLFHKMQLEDISPDATTLICTLKACGSMKDMLMGRQIHSCAVALGHELDTTIGNSIVDTYAKCGCLKEALCVFDLLPSKSIITWNTLITGLSELAPGEDTLRCIDLMCREGFSLDSTTYVCSLKACYSLKLIPYGQKQHQRILMKGLEGHSFIGCALVDMYANSGMLKEAQKLLDDLPVRNVVAWTALIAGYAEHGLGLLVLDCFERMIVDGISPTTVTYTCILKVCGNLSALMKGEEVHSRITKEGLSGYHTKLHVKAQFLLPSQKSGLARTAGEVLLISNALIDMYCKCGCMVDAQKLFTKMPVADTLTYNALLAGYARQGDTELVFYFFEKANRVGIKPNEIMLLTVVSVCSHEGLLGIGQQCFATLLEDYCMLATLEHYNCLLDLFSRAGQLKEAKTLLENMPFEPDLVTWSTLLGASSNWGDIDVGRQSFEWVARFDGGNAAAYIVMSNIYAAAGMREDAKVMASLKKLLQVWD